MGTFFNLAQTMAKICCPRAGGNFFPPGAGVSSDNCSTLLDMLQFFTLILGSKKVYARSTTVLVAIKMQANTRLVAIMRS